MKHFKHFAKCLKCFNPRPLGRGKQLKGFAKGISPLLSASEAGRIRVMIAKTLRGAHSRYNIKYHFVWIVKYRKDLLQGELQQYVGQIIRGIGERYWISIDTLGTDGNHIHVFCQSAPRYSPAKIANILKSVSAHKIFERFPDLRWKELWGGEFWGDGYYVRTVGDEVTTTVIREYIKRQGKQHKPFDQLRLF